MKFDTSFVNSNSLGPYTHLARMAFLSLIVLTISRAGLVLWNYDRVANTASFASIFLQGIRADIILISLWLLIPVGCVPLLAWRRWSKIWFKFTYLWCLIGLISILFLELATPAFLMQFDLRPNRIFIEYLKYPREVLSTLWHGFRLPFVAGLVLTALIGYGLHRFLFLTNNHLTVWPPLKSLLIWPLIFIMVFVGIRSTLGHRPANPALFAITGDSMVNSLVINSGYSVLYAFYNMKHEARSSEIYGKLSVSEMLQYSLDWPWLKKYAFQNPEYPTLHYQSAETKRERPLNLVIVLQESMGATFVKSLGGVAVTPELEKLALEGMWFERLYATGTRSVRGIEAVVAGYLPTPAQSVVKLSKSQNNFTTLASILKSAGYQTQFIYGGEAHFDNMRGFFTNNGFEDIVDIKKIDNPVFVGSWGASDEDLFKTAEHQIEALHNTGKPFFSLVFTSSNHEPFEFPENRIALFEQPKKTANNAVKYADWAMGKFFEHAKLRPYWQDTLFLVVADHDNRVYGSNLIPVEKFQIPGLILGASIPPSRISTLSSQIDLAPTLLSLMGVSACHPMIGRDLINDQTSPGRAFLQFEDYFALMEQGKIIVLKPDQDAVIMKYDENLKKLDLVGEASDHEVKKALAHVQLPSYLYREGKYSSNNTCN